MQTDAKRNTKDTSSRLLHLTCCGNERRSYCKCMKFLAAIKNTRCKLRKTGPSINCIPAPYQEMPEGALWWWIQLITQRKWKVPFFLSVSFEGRCVGMFSEARCCSFGGVRTKHLQNHVSGTFIPELGQIVCKMYLPKRWSTWWV